MEQNDKRINAIGSKVQHYRLSHKDNKKWRRGRNREWQTNNCNECKQSRAEQMQHSDFCITLQMNDLLCLSQTFRASSSASLSLSLWANSASASRVLPAWNGKHRALSNPSRRYNKSREEEKKGNLWFDRADGNKDKDCWLFDLMMVYDEQKKEKHDEQIRNSTIGGCKWYRTKYRRKTLSSKLRQHATLHRNWIEEGNFGNASLPKISIFVIFENMNMTGFDVTNCASCYGNSFPFLNSAIWHLGKRRNSSFNIKKSEIEISLCLNTRIN